MVIGKRQSWSELNEYRPLQRLTLMTTIGKSPAARGGR